LLLPAATACAPATFGLSASPAWPSLSRLSTLIDSNNRLSTIIRHTLLMLFPAPLPDHSVFGLPADQLHSVRSTPAAAKARYHYALQMLLDAFLNLFRRTCPLYVLSTCNRTAHDFHLCAAGPFPSETLGLASRQNRHCSLPLLRPCRGSPCCLPPLPLAGQLQKTQASSDSGHRTLALMAMYLNQIVAQQ
jgi:hypothetical protein